MSGPGRRFDPSELHSADGRGRAAEAADRSRRRATGSGLAANAGSPPRFRGPGHDGRRRRGAAAPDRPGRVPRRPGSQFRDAWRIIWWADRPLAVRAQAFALVLLVLVAVGSTGTLAAVGVSASSPARRRGRSGAAAVEPSLGPPSPAVRTINGAERGPSPSTSPPRDRRTRARGPTPPRRRGDRDAEPTETARRTETADPERRHARTDRHRAPTEDTQDPDDTPIRPDDSSGLGPRRRLRRRRRRQRAWRRRAAPGRRSRRATRPARTLAP